MSSPVTWATRTPSSARSRTCSARRSRTRPSSRCSRSSSSSRSRSSAASSPRCSEGRAARPRDLDRRPLGHGDPRVRLGGRRDPRLRALARRPAGDRARRREARASSPRSSTSSCPRSASCFVLFGYIARMARAGTIESLDADYTRTAVLKGLPRRTVIRRHVLRNSLLPTIAVDRDADRLPDRRPRRDRADLQLPRDRPAHRPRAPAQKDFPLLEAAVLVVGIVYLAGDPGRRPRLRRPEPAHPLRRRRVMSTSDDQRARRRPRRRERGEPRAARAAPARPPLADVPGGSRHRRVLDPLRDLRLRGRARTIRSPTTSSTSCSRPRPATTGSARTGSAATSSRG